MIQVGKLMQKHLVLPHGPFFHGGCLKLFVAFNLINTEWQRNLQTNCHISVIRFYDLLVM